MQPPVNCGAITRSMSHKLQQPLLNHSSCLVLGRNPVQLLKAEIEAGMRHAPNLKSRIFEIPKTPPCHHLCQLRLSTSALSTTQPLPMNVNFINDMPLISSLVQSNCQRKFDLRMGFFSAGNGGPIQRLATLDGPRDRYQGVL